MCSNLSGIEVRRCLKFCFSRTGPIDRKTIDQKTIDQKTIDQKIGQICFVSQRITGGWG